MVFLYNVLRVNYLRGKLDTTIAQRYIQGMNNFSQHPHYIKTLKNVTYFFFFGCFKKIFFFYGSGI